MEIRFEVDRFCAPDEEREAPSIWGSTISSLDNRRKTDACRIGSGGGPTRGIDCAHLNTVRRERIAWEVAGYDTETPVSSANRFSFATQMKRLSKS